MFSMGSGVSLTQLPDGCVNLGKLLYLSGRIKLLNYQKKKKKKKKKNPKPTTTFIRVFEKY